jgi:hypothetical protein
MSSSDGRDDLIGGTTTEGPGKHIVSRFQKCFGENCGCFSSSHTARMSLAEEHAMRKENDMY